METEKDPDEESERLCRYTEYSEEKWRRIFGSGISELSYRLKIEVFKEEVAIKKI